MTMQSSGPISMGQAMAECQVGGRYNMGSQALSKLAGVSPGQRYAFSYWYGKSNGTPVFEQGTQYYNINYSGASWANFQRSLFLFVGSSVFRQSGGDTTVTGNYPNQPTNGFTISGFFRAGTNLTVIAGNCSLDGVTFQSAIGDNVTLTNDISYSAQFGPNLWTFYGARNAVNQGGGRNYTVSLVGTAQRPQPPAGYMNGQPPPTNGGGDTGGGGGGCCFVAGSLVLMADLTWKHVETIQSGDMVMGPEGPARVKRLYVTTLDDRRLLTFKEDPSIVWSEEHPFWSRRNGVQWWWTASLPHLRAEIESGLLPGLKDIDSVYTGQVEYAHLEGFVNRTVVEIPDADPALKLYIPVIEGSPCVMNGYVVSAFINEFGYDYRSMDWNEGAARLGRCRASLQVLKNWRSWLRQDEAMIS